MYKNTCIGAILLVQRVDSRALYFADMKIILLTHKLELNKTTNTGLIAVKHASHVVKRILWQRTTPNNYLLDLIDNNEALLLYPVRDLDAPGFNEHKSEDHRIENFDNIVIIDGTWQQSRKIFNKSPYLKKMPMASFGATHSSKYILRRNQIEGGLCTIECVIEVLKLVGDIDLASSLDIEFSKFNNRRITSAG